MRPEVRLVTLTGPGGVGKTRLALEAAHDLEGDFSDGALFVRLDGLNDPALVLPALAGELRLLETGGDVPLLDRLAVHLAEHELLVVLDNLEHLLPAAPALADFLHRAPGVTLLVTSREALRVRGEHVIAIAPFPRPDPSHWLAPGGHVNLEQAPAISLFVQRALAAPPVLSVDAETPGGRANLAIIAETCHRLDGLPLAIELAAAQAQILSPAAVLALIKQAGLPLLADGARDQPARLQTMDAAIAWSYNLLPDPEKVLFRALAVFAGGFDLAAAAAVGSTSPTEHGGVVKRVNPIEPLAEIDPIIVRGVAALARQHLIAQETSAPGQPAPRFRMLEPIRLFALDRLREAGEETSAHRRHAAYFAALGEALDALLLGPEPEIWSPRFALELDNFRAAQDWSFSAGEHDLAVRTVCAVGELWEMKGLLAEARDRVSRAIAVEGDSSPAHRWFLRYWAGTFALDWGNVAGAIDYADELLDIAEAHGQPVGLGVGLTLKSQAVGSYPDRHEEAAGLARRAVAVLEPLGHDEWTGWAWARLGIEEHRLRRLADARASLQRSVDVRRGKPCAEYASYALVSLGAILADLDEPEAAVTTYRESLELAVRHENQTVLLAVLLGLADVGSRFGVEPDAQRIVLLLIGAAKALLRRHGLGQDGSAREGIDRWLLSLRGASGDDDVDAQIEDGMRLTPAAIIAAVESLRVSASSGVAGPQFSLLEVLGTIE